MINQPQLPGKPGQAPIWLAAKSREGDAGSPVSLEMRMRSSQWARLGHLQHAGTVGQLEVGELCSRAAGAGVGRERGDAVPVDVGDAQLGAGVGSFLAGDDAHGGRPGGQVQQVSQLGDPRPVAGGVVGVMRLRPPAGGEFEHWSRSGMFSGRVNPTEYDNC